MTMITKIADRHLSRQACIYIRQSTLAQVRSNQESTDRQYNLLNKAQSLGWTAKRTPILTAISDSPVQQLQSVRTSRPWSAMWRWVRSVRSSPWKHPGWRDRTRTGHRLLELCAITGRLRAIEQDGCYDPAELNEASCSA